MRLALPSLIFLLFLTGCKADPVSLLQPPEDPKPTLPPIPQLAIDLVTDSEVSASSTEGHRYYDKHYTHATRPEDDKSGPTIAVGVDLGQNDADYTQDCWGHYYPDPIVARFVAISGHYGPNSDKYVRSLQDVTTLWTIAIDEFIKYELSHYQDLCEHYLPGFKNLRPNARGALVSLSYNRGFSYDFGGSRYKEMRAIKADVTRSDYEDMADQLRSMERIWRGTNEGNGLIARREAEAKLMETP
jgi:GH24 family phage-related lysozyme (muramidase)